MKFPSFYEVSQETQKALFRFPIASLCATIGTVLSILLVNYEPSETEIFPWIKSIGTCLIGLPLFFSIHLYVEKNGIVSNKKVAFLLGGALILLFAFLTFQLHPRFESPTSLFRFFIWLIAAHLLVSMSAFQNKGEKIGFWQINKLMFLRFAGSAFFSLVLFLGLAGALLSIKALFEIEIDEKWYAYLWIFLAGIFNTFYFMAGIPDDINSLQTETPYPKGLRIFAQFILMPLVIIYLVILYLYGGKIIFQGHLPIGWVSNLILTFSVFGILALLLIYPLRNDEKHLWIKSYFRAYFIAILPLIALLFVSIMKRINDYGITEWRYIGFVLGCWLLILSIYFIFSKSKNIFYIPFSLFIICILGTTGFWNMFQTTKFSQVKRLEHLLSVNKILQNEKIDCNLPQKKLKAEEAESIGSIVNFLVDQKHYSALFPYFDKNCLPLDSTAYEIINKIPYVASDNYKPYTYNTIEINFNNQVQKQINIEGFKYIYPQLELYQGYEENIPDIPISIIFKDHEILFYKNKKLQFNYNILPFTQEIIKKNKENGLINIDKETFVDIKNKDNQSFRIIFNNIFIEKDLMDETFLNIQHINISVLEK